MLFFRNFVLEKRLITFFFLFPCLASWSQNRFEYTHQQMGTQIRLVFYTKHKNKADSIATMAFRRIDDLNIVFSDYLEDSELNLLSKQPFKEVVVSDDLFNVLQKAVGISEITNGAFDVTVGPLIKLWRETHKTKEYPSISDMAAAKKSVGFRYITFPDQNIVQLNAKKMQLDLGGIGKGFAADEVIKLLEFHGISSALIDMGGDISVSSPPPNKEYWILAFSYYDKEGKETIQRIQLKNAAVATSGDLYQFVEINGIRYSQIIDPLTGMALNTNIQVTTIAQNATEADAYASAFSVMGIPQTMDFVKAMSTIDVFMVQKSKNTFKQWSNYNFPILQD